MNLIRCLLICRKHGSIWQNFYINGHTKGLRGSSGRNYPFDAIETPSSTLELYSKQPPHTKNGIFSDLFGGTYATHVANYLGIAPREGDMMLPPAYLDYDAIIQEE